MMQVNMFEAKSDLSRLVKLLETNQEDVIYIARNGVGIAQLTLIDTPVEKRIGVAKGLFTTPDEFDSDKWNSEIEELFGGSEL